MFGNFQDHEKRIQCIKGWRYTTSLNDYGVYFYIHIKGGFAMNISQKKKGIHRAWPAYIRILLIGRASNTRNEILEI